LAIPAFCEISAIDVLETPCVVKSLKAVSKREVLFCQLIFYHVENKKSIKK